MAYVKARQNAQGRITSFQVKWRLGGGRSAPQQVERFDDEESAEVFKDAVNEAGQQWPPGWVKGQGYIDPAADQVDDERYRFANFARESIKNRTAVEDRYRDAILKEAETYLFPTFGTCDIRSTEHFSKATISAWQNAMCETMVWRGSKRKKMSPKTVKNLRGLLSSILDEAVKHEPPLRQRNPCELVRLPRTDADGDEDGDDGGGGEELLFLTPEEVEAIAAHMPVESSGDLVRVKYATGARWGEITAVARRHLQPEHVSTDGKPRMRIARAWKRSKEKGWYLGKPKSKRSRRTLRVDAVTWDLMTKRGFLDLKPNDLIFAGPNGGRLTYSTFYDHWQIAVSRAKQAGVLPEWKQPTPHDLRHSHAASLLSAGHSLTYVQRRLGHESITTTSDRYGHLLPEADDAAMATIERSLGGGEPEECDTEPVAPMPHRPVHAVHLGEKLLGFWSRELAEQTATGWAHDAGGAVRMETWSLEWWQRQVPRGVAAVRSSVPDRVWVWSVGPVRYAADGTELSAGPGAHEVSGRWLWEFERGYTDEPAQSRTGWVAGEPVTEAAAWGLDRAAVEEAYGQARTDALRVCGLNPVATSSAPVSDRGTIPEN
ncbi:tyrosine-type recombinase/integrase [Streptomyces sioyaensis]|uniref:tyrosine-type recombinase/integrase n=1 Tax=Streptomyces sioyaensis TaxID=67364 RepID=UPI003D7661E9